MPAAIHLNRSPTIGAGCRTSRQPAESDAEGSIMKMRLRTLGVVAVLFTCSWQIGGQVREFRPVSDAMLQRPEAGDWLHWRRALDAASGDLLWEYAHTFERSPDVSLPSRLRSIAIAADKVLLATPNAHLVALDARTGKVVRD